MTTSMGDTGRVTFRKKALASLGVTAGMFLLPAAYMMLESYGPSSRIVYYGYLFPQNAENYPLAGILGAWLGARSCRLFSRQTHFSITRLAAGCVIGGFLGFTAVAVATLAALQLTTTQTTVFVGVIYIGFVIVPVVGAWLGGIVLFKPTAPAAGHGRYPWLQPSAAILLIVWLLLPQFRAFPKDGTVAEREAWALSHVPQYASLTRVVAKIPIVAENVGPIVAIAPTGGDDHIAAGDMDGVGFNFTLDVVGEKGHGVFRVLCTIDGDMVFEWQTGTWMFNGQTTEIATVPNLIHRGP
ncbi:MAG TPA: hypothetical protein VN802_16065 [Stellaceae bacterium]|nr:hypothetical protein [Stellaceae bacterium]